MALWRIEQRKLESFVYFSCYLNLSFATFIAGPIPMMTAWGGGQTKIFSTTKLSKTTAKTIVFGTWVAFTPDMTGLIL